VEVKRAVPRPFIRQGQHSDYPERRETFPVVTQSSAVAQSQSQSSTPALATEIPQVSQQQQPLQQQQLEQTSTQIQVTAASAPSVATPNLPIQQQQVQLVQQHHIFQHHIQQQHMQQQHPHSLSPQHSPHHQHYTHQQMQQMQHFQQLQYQQLQQYQHQQQHLNPYMQGQPILMAPLGIPDMSYATDMMVDDQGVVYESMDNMHMDNTSKNSSLDVPTDMDTVANNDGSGYGKLEISEQALREEMSEWMISHVKIVRKVAEKYVSVLFDAEVGSVDRLRKKLMRYPAFLRDLQFDLDDCDDLITAVFAPPPPCVDYATGNCSPTSSSSYSSVDVVAAVNNIHFSNPCETGVNVAASAALANALSLGNNSYN